MNDMNSLSHMKWECKYHIVFVPVEEHISCHKRAYTGKSGITRDRTGKPWYYRNLKR